MDKLFIEKFDNGMQIMQFSKMKITSDTLCLLDFIEINENEIVIDLGTGSGVIPIVLQAKYKIKKIWGVEIQKELAILAQKNIKLNKANIEIINEDLKKLDQIFSFNMFDVITCNPPYYKINNNRQCSDIKQNISKHEVKCKLEDIIKISSYLLKPNGKIYLINLFSRFNELMDLLQKYHLNLTTLQYICSKKKEEKILFLSEIKKEKCEIQIKPNLYL
ncbi:MAG: methyltransferase [bacterium]